MRFGLQLTHHDFDYVDRRGGAPLFSHMRGVAGRARYREEAVRRAERLYVGSAAGGAGADNTRIAGLGLLVIQRASLAAEDLGGLLWALDGEDPWSRLTSTSVDQIDSVFRSVLTEPEKLLRHFRLPTALAVDEEPGVHAAQRAAIRRLIELHSLFWSYQLGVVARLWLRYKDLAKSTMHGYPVVAAEHFVGAPGPGGMDPGVRPPANAIFAVAVPTTWRPDGGTNTAVRVIELHPERVRWIRTAGTVAARLTRTLCEQQANSIESGHAFVVPFTRTRLLGDAERRHLDALRDDHP